MNNNRIELKRGDYVSTDGMTEGQYHAVALAFENAGCPRRDRSKGRGTGSYLEWYRGALVSTNYPANSGRHLTIDQVLGATNAKPENGEDSHCPQDIRAIVNVNLHTQGDAQAFRDAFDNLKSGYGDFPTMTAAQLDTIADPITTLKQARQARDEAEQAYQEALGEAREYLGEGFELTEVGIDAASADRLRKSLAAAMQIPERMLFGDAEEDIPVREWKTGDYVTCVEEHDEHVGKFTVGKTYRVWDGDGSRLPGIESDQGKERYAHGKCFRFHHRPT